MAASSWKDEEVVSQECLLELERAYNVAKKNQALTPDIVFPYAVCLVKRRFPLDIERGIHLLEEVASNCKDPELRAQCLFHIGCGNARLKKTSASKKAAEEYCRMKPSCSLGSGLRADMRQEHKIETATSAAIGTGVIVGLGAIVLGLFAVLKTNNKQK